MIIRHSSPAKNAFHFADLFNGLSFSYLTEDNTEGVPEFWLTIFKNVDMLADMVQEHDEPVLKHLQDIKVNFHKTNPMVCSM